MAIDANSIIQRANQQLRFLGEAVTELENTPTNIPIRQKAYANVLVWGRSVTFVLQNLKSVVGEDNFDRWYNPIQENMKSDHLLITFKNSRNILEKRGFLEVSTRVWFGKHRADILKELNSKIPPNAIETFTIDQWGGAGWIVRLPDGSTERLYEYVTLRDKIHVEVMVFSKDDLYHKGVKISNTSIENCSRLYYIYLKEIVDSATKTFIIK